MSSPNHNNLQDVTFQPIDRAAVAPDPTPIDLHRIWVAHPSELTMDVDGYQRLAAVLYGAYGQASGGKGRERHANGLPFERQPMAEINKLLGSRDGFLYQAMKKIVESKRLPRERAIAELYGAINYIAGAVISLEDEPGAAG